SVVKRIWVEKEPEFSGSLATLRAGGRLVAMDFGIRSRSVLHGWFPAYDPNLGAYSPGTILSLAIIALAPSHGISMIDLGKGRAFYKQRLANASIPLLEGSVFANAWKATAQLGRLRM